MATADYLWRRGHTWFVRVQIPKKLWGAAGGKRAFVKSLKTRDLNAANSNKHVWVAEFKRRIRALESTKDGGADQLADIYERALSLRGALEHAKAQGVVFDFNGQQETLYEHILSDTLDEAKELADTHGDDVARRFHRIVTTITVTEFVEPWLTEQAGQITGQTVSQHRSAVKAFLVWAGEHVSIAEIDRRRAGQYVAELLGAESKLSRKTAKRHVSSLSSFWKWLKARGHAEAENNPWLGQALGSKGTRGQSTPRRQWKDEELVKLLKGTLTERYTVTLHDLVRLALVTGARIEELCALEKQDATKRADGWWIAIRKGKTQASVREVPLHNSAAHVLERRSAARGDFLFPSLVPGGPDKKRSWNASKAFGRYRATLGLTDKAQVFHSLRATFIEAMEAAEVPESTVKLLVGHKRTSMTFGHYSKGVRVKLRESIDKLWYSPEVMRAIGKRESDTGLDAIRRNERGSGTKSKGQTTRRGTR